MVIDEMLTAMAFQVTSVASGAEALAELRAVDDSDHSYSLVYLDWRMPEMDGLETAARIRELQLADEPRLVMLTAYDQTEVVDRARKLGIEEVMTKPVTPSALLDMTMSVMSGSVARRGITMTSDEGDGAGGGFSGQRILLVEDNEGNQEVAMGLLSETGLQIDLAENGAIALEKLAQNEYAVVLMDVQMPVMDGIAATREIRRTPALQSVPVVAMTANAMQRDQEICLEAGMSDFVAKPIDPEELLRVLRRWLPSRLGVDLEVHRATPADLEGLPDLEGLDVAAGVLRVGGKPEKYLSLLRMFVRGQADASERVSQALGKGDLFEVELIAHTVKGLAGNIGAVVVQEHAATLEGAVRDKKGADEIASAQAAFAAALGEFLAGLEEALPSDSGEGAEGRAPEGTDELSEAELDELAAVTTRLLGLLEEGSSAPPSSSLRSRVFSGARTRAISTPCATPSRASTSIRPPTCCARP